MKITGDRDVCVGSGLCALHAPELFDQNEDDGTVQVLVPSPPPEQHDLAELAMQSCPAHAISVTE
ncbi:ferredoxin [Streptomyces sp. PU-14G]|uniref:ferredoxin n=1 Tax=Streptomyces sp. PU-14G TaxID=2800808 RepID=UPI0034DF2B30